nr:putative PKHD-type hydroxylase [Tanacetum cinerariifolium]
MHLHEVFDYSHSVGCAIIHCGRHGHGARATTSRNRINLMLWCQSSVFQELKNIKRISYNYVESAKRRRKRDLWIPWLHGNMYYSCNYTCQDSTLIFIGDEEGGSGFATVAAAAAAGGVSGFDFLHVD